MYSTGTGMEVTEFFDLLESSNPAIVEDIRILVQDNMSNTKDSWLVNGLFDYYLSTGSERCMDVLIGISREPHDKYLIDKICEGLRSPQTRKSSFTFLGNLVRKQPAWLYKISQYGLVKELFRILKIESDIVILMTGLLTIINLLPIIPTCLGPTINEVFEIFGRLTTWAHSSHRVANEDHLLHLQVGLYSLFHRLYAMFPCNFLSYLRHTFSTTERRGVFLQTIKPMLETVKMHPMLVTATKESELLPARWKNKEYHEIIAECSQVSLDVLESGLAEEINPTPLRPRICTNMDTPHNAGPLCTPQSDIGQTPPVQVLQQPVSTLIHQSISFEITDLSGLATMIEDTSAPPTTPMSISSTPSNITAPSTSALLKTKSPPETAMEATPENTPVPTPVKDRNVTHFKLPPPGSPAVMHLAFGKPTSLTAGTTPHTPTPTPSNSVPSSPAPHTGGDGNSGAGGGGSLHRRDSIFDSGGTVIRKDSVIFQRLQKIMVEQQEGGATDSGRKPNPLTLLDAAVISTLEPIVGSVGHEGSLGGGPLTPMLGSTVPSELNSESMDDEEADELKNDTVPMPDKRSMIAFAQRVKRLRFYSQCGGEQASSGASPGTSPSTSFVTPSRLKRSTSCPDIFKKQIREEPMDSTDGVSSSSHQVDSDDPTSTPKAEPVQPYEHLFDGVLPQFLQHPGEGHSQFESPHHLLDLCVSKAASLHGMSRGDELNLLRGHVELLHTQLLFERHRREAHALRNRSLAKRCRTLQQQEDKTYALRSQMHSMEKELAILKKEVTLQRNQGLAKEKELQQDIIGLEKQVEALKKQQSVLRSEKEMVDTKFSKMKDEFQVLQKETDQLKAEIFQLESEIHHCKKFVEINGALKAAYETAQKEILMLGELYRRQDEVLLSLEPNRYLAYEIEDLRLTFEDELKNLRSILETKSSQTEAALGFINNLEAQLAKKDTVINEQKKLVNDASYEYDAQLKALEDKYETLKAVNHRLELEILNLQHQVTVRAHAPSRGNIRRISPSNGESLHNSNNSDVDSAASAGGLNITPGERSVFIFGSPQFGPTPVNMNDLQRVIEAVDVNAGNEHRRVTRSMEGASGSGRRPSGDFDSPPRNY